jgi:hypothetical protein
LSQLASKLGRSASFDAAGPRVNNSIMKDEIARLVENYAHYYRDMAMSEDALARTLNSFALDVLLIVKSNL